MYIHNKHPATRGLLNSSAIFLSKFFFNLYFLTLWSVLGLSWSVPVILSTSFLCFCFFSAMVHVGDHTFYGIPLLSFNYNSKLIVICLFPQRFATKQLFFLLPFIYVRGISKERKDIIPHN